MASCVWDNYTFLTVHFFLQPAILVEITMEAANRSVSSATEPTMMAWVTAASAPLASTWMWMGTAVLVRNWFGLSFWKVAQGYVLLLDSGHLSRHCSLLFTELCLSNMSVSWDSPLIPHLGFPGAPFLFCILPKIFVYLFNYAF